MIKVERGSPQDRPYFQGDAFQIIFRYGAKFFVISRVYNLMAIYNFAYP